MADAIPLNLSNPETPAPVVRVDANGIPLPGDYVTAARENLGEPGEVKRVTEVEAQYGAVASPEFLASRPKSRGVVPGTTVIREDY